MEWVNITAKTLPEAIDLALDNLGVDEAEAEIEVLEEPKQGLFGRTRGNARVRARVKPKGTRPKVERGRTRKRRSEGESAAGESRGGGEGSGSRGGRSAGGRTRSVGEDQRAAATADTDDAGAPTGGSDETEVEEATEPVRERSGPGSRGGRSGGGRGRNGGGGTSGRRNGDGLGKENAEEATMEDVSSQLEEFLSGLTSAFGYDDTVSIIADDDEGIIGCVEGRHGLMVGPRARTLEAIQELARVSVQRSAPSSIRIKVDVGGYRQSRREALEAFALQAAAAVRLDGRERLLEPMNSADRKIVHDALSGEAGIETRSAGNEPNRRVVVVPVAGSGRPGATDDVETDEIGDVGPGSESGEEEEPVAAGSEVDAGGVEDSGESAVNGQRSSDEEASGEATEPGPEPGPEREA